MTPLASLALLTAMVLVVGNWVIESIETSRREKARADAMAHHPSVTGRRRQ